MTTKVTTTEKYNDSQGEHIVTKGVLKLIDAPVGGSNNMIATGKLINGIPMAQISIIISNEPIEISNKVLYNGKIEEASAYTITQNVSIFLRIDDDNRVEVYLSDCDKVIAFPNHFSPKHLQAIVDGKLKDGDEVLVECQQIATYTTGEPCCITKLNKSSHIKLFRVNKEITWEDPIKIMETFIKNNPEKVAEIIAKAELQEHHGPTVDEYFGSFGNYIGKEKTWEEVLDVPEIPCHITQELIDYLNIHFRVHEK